MKKTLSEKESLEIIDGCLYGVLSLLDGERPYGVPLSVARDGRMVYFHGRLTGRKADLIAVGGTAHMVFVGQTQVVPERFTTLYRSVMGEGIVETVLDEEERIRGLRLLSEKYVPESMGDFEKEIRSSLHRTAVYRFKLEKIVGKDTIGS